MNKGLVKILVGIIAVLLVVVLIITLSKKNIQEPVELIKVNYTLVSSKVENNNVKVVFNATVVSGQKVDPITYVRLVDSEGFPLYPVNGYPKILMNNGDKQDFEYSFDLPNTVNSTLEIKNSSGDVYSMGLMFPEIATLDNNIKGDDSLLAIGERYVLEEKEAYTINSYNFSVNGQKKAPEGSKYLLLNITVENLSATNQMALNEEIFVLKSGETIIPAVDLVSAGGKEVLLKTLEPLEKHTGEMSFLVSTEYPSVDLYIKGVKIFSIKSN